ncbi:MAG: DNA-processing protein DprA [Candidatus Zixiibacteriota bacterium]
MTNHADNTEIIRILALSHFSSVQPRLLEVLIRHYGSLERIMATDAGSLMAVAGMTAEIANRVAEAPSKMTQARQYYELLRSKNVNFVSRFDSDYPKLLFELNDPPTLLYYRGTLPNENSKIVALAGGDRATSEGIELTVEAAKKFAEAGVQVISSLDRGIDSATHLGAKVGAGRSFSVLDSGVDEIYPDESRPLAIDIVKDGGLISEYPPDQKYHTENFKSSNRIIAGLSQAVVMTEFYDHSMRALDLLSCCSQIGKLVFILIDPRHGALTDKNSLETAYSSGAIPMVGLHQIDEIVKSLV